jgi:L-iditol 2-dehydrogenase
MRAAVLYGAKDLRIVDIPMPAVGRFGLLLKIEACGVCGSDLRTWREGLAPGRDPLVMGHEIVGRVVERGPDGPESYAEGTRVVLGADINCGQCYYCQRGLYNLCIGKKILGRDVPGGYAEYIWLDKQILENGIVCPVTNEHLSSSVATLAEPLASVLNIHERLHTGSEHVVVIIGGGPIGCLHAKVAQMRGAFTILADIDVKRLEIAQKLIQHGVFVHSGTQNLLESVRRLTDGLGADIAIVACSSKSAQLQAVELVKKRGIVVFFGGLPKGDSITQIDANLVHYGEVTITGAFSYAPWHVCSAIELLSSERLNVQGFVQEYSLTDAPKLFERLGGGVGEADVLKPVLIP